VLLAPVASADAHITAAYDPNRTWTDPLTAILCVDADVNRYDPVSLASGQR